MTRAAILKQLSKLSGQARIDALIDLLHSRQRRTLRDSDYWMAFPDPCVAEALKDAAGGSDAFVWPDGYDAASQGRWTCQAFYNIFHIRLKEFQPSDMVHYLQDSVPPARLARLMEDELPTKAEIRQFKLAFAKVRNESGDGTVLYCFTTKDFKGREMRFVWRIGDWGSVVGTYGPYAKESILAPFKNADHVILGERLWEADTDGNQIADGDPGKFVWIRDSVKRKRKTTSRSKRATKLRSGGQTRKRKEGRRPA